MTDDLNQIGPWIVEGLMTTLGPDGQLHMAPMGPRINADFSQFVLRPFKTSNTYRNLKATGQGVFHITDDALLIARAAVGLLNRHPAPVTQQAQHIQGRILTHACRYHELRMVSLDDAQDRATIHLRCVHTQSLRDFFGFNRARHAVIEAAILATRVHLTGPESVLAEFEKLQIMVDKTGGPDEHLAMSELKEYVRQYKRI